jgi:hypothetical protein
MKGAARQEDQHERQARLTSLEIVPGDLTIALDERVIFSAIGFTADETPVGGVAVIWHCYAGKAEQGSISPRGEFLARHPGVYTVTAEACGCSARVTVAVPEGTRRSRAKAFPQEAAASSH